MPTLDFKGKQFVHSHHLSVPFRELRVEGKKSLPVKGGKPSLDDNLIIHGDNLEALKALLPTHAGKVDCIFIDPPYNTGNEGWCYNDNVRSPLMKEWLKKSANPVDKEDLERHDKWLCMMWPRLQLLRELLAENGAIFITIDDNEVHRLRALMEEIFGEENFVANIVWRRTVSRGVSGEGVLVSHDNILFYRKGNELAVARNENADPADYKNPDDDPRGPYKTQKLERTLEGARPTMTFTIDTPKGPIFKTWAVRPETYKELLADNRVVFSPKSGMPYYKQFLNEFKGVLPDTWWDEKGGYNQDASKELKEIMGGKVDFSYPKPMSLVAELFSLCCPGDGLVLDSFAGSGTTAHAVLAANAKDGGNRRFILVETEDYADTLTAERVRRVIQGYAFTGTQRTELMSEKLTWTAFKKAAELLEKVESIEQFEGADFDIVKKEIKDGVLTVTGERKIKEKAPGLGGSFTYCELGEPIDIESLLTGGGSMPSYESLARYVFYTATGRSLDKVAAPKADGFIGETEVFRLHLIYKPDKEWLRSNEASLDAKKLEAIEKGNKAGKRAIVFAVAKFMSQKELTARRIEFCQLPYAVHKILGD